MRSLKQFLLSLGESVAEPDFINCIFLCFQWWGLPGLLVVSEASFYELVSVESERALSASNFFLMKHNDAQELITGTNWYFFS